MKIPIEKLNSHWQGILQLWRMLLSKVSQKSLTTHWNQFRIKHRIILAWKDLKDHQVQPYCHRAGTLSTCPGCSEPHPPWPWKLPGMGHPWFLWAACSNASPPSQYRIFSQYLHSLKAIPPCSPVQSPLFKVPLQHSCSPFWYWKVLEGLPKAFPSPGWRTFSTCLLVKGLTKTSPSMCAVPVAECFSVICGRKLKQCNYLLCHHPCQERWVEQDLPVARTRYCKSSLAIHREQKIKEGEDLLNCSKLLRVIV